MCVFQKWIHSLIDVDITDKLKIECYLCHHINIIIAITRWDDVRNSRFVILPTKTRMVSRLDFIQ